MAIATDIQIQAFVDARVRVRAEQIRALYLAMKDDRAAFDDVYNALTQASPTWEDTRVDAPHKLIPSDVLAWNTFLFGLIACVEAGNTADMAQAGPQYPIVLSACVRPVQL